MWEKFKETKFAQKCKELSGKKGIVATTLILVIALAVVLTVSIVNNRAKKQNNGGLPEGTAGKNEQTTEGKNEDVMQGTVDAPVHKDETESLPVAAEPEEFKLEAPVTGVLAKGHDNTIQVWSETMGDYRVHLGLDITTEAGAPVFAAADGVVSKVWDDALMGRCVAISHDDGIFTFYKNLDPVLSGGIEQNAKVKCGQQLGKVGESAIAELADEPHLHIEMTVNGLAVDPADYFSDKAKDALKKDTAYESTVKDEQVTE